MNKWICLAAGGVLGTFGRYLVSEAVDRRIGTGFPYGTLIVNVVGCFLIGVFSVMADDHLFLGSSGRILLVVGFCGAFTTFSTYILETGALARDAGITLAFLNILISTVVGFLAYRLGAFAGKIF